jgi:hypothetical protein
MLVTAQPLHRLFERRRRQAARHHASGLFARDQTGIRENVEMLHDRR